MLLTGCIRDSTCKCHCLDIPSLLLLTVCDAPVVCSLVQWCHGAPGMVQLLQEASQPRWQALFGQDLQLEARNAAAKAADIIWEQGLLVKVVPRAACTNEKR